MYRLMIVDDEHHIVDWLFDLFMEIPELDLDIIKAFSGSEALRILESNKIDIILSDVRMPGMNGLELLDKVYENWPGSKMIFLTGYNDFDFVYKAIKHEGVSYLLKTEDDDVIISAVKKSIESIEKELKNRDLLNQALDKDRLISHLTQKQMLMKIINGQITYGDIDQKEIDKFGIPLDVSQPLILILGRTNGDLANSDYIELSKNIISLHYLTQQYLSNAAEHVLIDVDKYHTLWVAQPKKAMIDKSNENENEEPWVKASINIKEMLETFQTACYESLDLKCSFFFYPKPVSWQMIEDRFSAMKSIANSRLGSLDRESMLIYTIDDNDEAMVNHYMKQFTTSNLQAKKLRMLQEYLEQGLENEFISVLRELNESIKDVSIHNISAVELYYSLSVLFLNDMNSCNLAENISLKISLNGLFNSSRFESWGEAFVYLEKLGNVIFSLKKDEKTSIEKEIILRIKSFVKNNIDGELTLIRISEKVNYNPSYISRFFKQSTGINLFDYISNIRISKAKELLENDNINILNIAKAVGYDSSQYFSTVFKKITGMTPIEYRNSIDR